MSGATRGEWGALHPASPVPLAARVGEALLEQGWTVAAAESCTAGLVLKRLTDVPGSSRYVLGGVVAYSDALKRRLLGVEGELLRRHGAVSESVARAMADGVVRATGADVGVAVTGIAGPDGGSDEKPVGTVWFAITAPGADPRTERVRFPGDREEIRNRAADRALELVLEAAR